MNEILKLCKTLHQHKFRITDDDLIELYSSDEDQFYNKFCEININYLTKKLDKALPIVESEQNTNRRNVMHQKINEWRKEVSEWKKLIV